MGNWESEFKILVTRTRLPSPPPLTFANQQQISRNKCIQIVCIQTNKQNSLGVDCVSKFNICIDGVYYITLSNSIQIFDLVGILNS